MAQKLSLEEFEQAAMQADLRRQAASVRQAQAAVQSERAAAELKLAEMAGGPTTPAVDPRNVPSTPQGEMLGPTTFEQRQFQSKAERPGVPLDMQTGAPFGMRALASQLPEDPEAQLAFWKGKLGSDKVDLVNGRYVLRNVPGQDGSVKDVVVDEERGSAKDFADALREAPEFIAAVIASAPGPGAAATRTKQLIDYVLKPAVKSAAAFQGVKQTKDIAARIGLDLPVDITRNLMSASEQGVWDIALGTALGAAPLGVGAAAKLSRQAIVKPAQLAAQGLESPRGLTQAQGLLGREALAAQTGIDIPVSAGQLTGFAPMIRIQQIAEKVPFVGSRIAANKAKQITKEKELQRLLVSTEPGSEELGQRAIATIRQPIQRYESELTELKKLLGDEQSAKLAQAFQLTAPERSGFEAALSLKQGTDDVYKNWKAENSVNYGRVYAMEEATARAIPLAQLKKTLDDVVLERQAKREVTTTEQLSEPLEGTIERTTETPVPGTLPSGISTLVSQIKGMGDKATLQELVDLRGRIQDAIQDPDILPGVDDYMRKRLSGAITSSIKSYADTAGNEQFKDALSFANKRYAEKVDLFESPGVRQLLLPREGRHAVNLDEYADAIFRGGRGAVERYQRVKSLLGEGSGAVEAFRQHFLQRIGKPAVNAITRSLDFETLADAVTKLPKEVADDLFPQSRTAILEAARAGQFAKGKVDYDAISDLIEKDTLTLGKIREIADKQEKLDGVLRNKIFQSVRDGQIDDISVQPDIFVDSILLSDKVPASQLRDTLAVIKFRNPDLADDIAFKYMAKMFREAADTGAQENITLASMGRVERNLDPRKFARFLDGPDQQARLKDVLGEDRFQILNNFNKHLATRQFAQDVAGAAGGLFGSNLLLDLFSAKNLYQMTKLGAMAALLSDSRLVRLISTPPPSGVAMSAWNKYLLRTAVLTPEFRRKMASDLSEEDLDAAAQQLQEFTQPPTQ